MTKPPGARPRRKTRTRRDVPAKRTEPRASESARPAPRTFSLAEIAERLGGKPEGSGDLRIDGVCTPEEPRENAILFVEKEGLLDRAEASPAAALVVSAAARPLSKPAVRVDNPRLAFALLLSIFDPAPAPVPGIDARAFVHPGARVAPDASVGPLARVGDGARIGPRTVLEAGSHVGRGAVTGEDCRLHPGAVLGDRCRIGDRVILYPNAVVGGDGFGFVRDAGRHRKIPQIGDVVVGDDVEIGACATIDRATVGSTVIGRGAKIDNLVQIAHNCVIGEDCILVAQVGIAGSCRIGNRCVLAGQAGLGDHVVLCDDVIVGGQSGFPSGHVIEKPGVYLGAPPEPLSRQKRILGALAHLPEIRDRLAALEDRLKGEKP
jgi:UDP-3-O-[3-hydroxymyristoyl] glucosamine N-acyltransferase